MRFGSLFSGIGGFDLGFEQAGLSCSWQVEIDGDCNRVLEKHWSGVAKHKDVRNVGQLESVDVICGGFPCQDLSVAGQRKGLAGERSGLWFEFLRIVGLNKPRWVVIENVPGLLSSDEHRDFAAILRGLVECGYCLAWRVCDAQFYGVAQRRRRVFIVGSLGDGSCAEILFESESVSWNPPTRREAGAGVTPILEAGARTNCDGRRDGDGIGVEGDPMFTLQSGKQHGVAATLTGHFPGQSNRWAPSNEADNLQVAANNFGERDISTALSSRNERIDGDTETFVVANNPEIAMPLKAKANSSHDESHETYVTHALRSEGADASEDGTGRGTPIVVANCFNGYTGGPDDNDAQANHIIAFAQNTRDEVRIQGDGKISGALANQPGMKQQTYVAFGWNKSESQTMRVDGEATDALQASSTSNPAIAFTERTRAEGRTFEAQEELAYAVTNPGSGGRTHSRQIAGGFGVRRLTPRECEFLQGFPSDWTRYDANGKEISDSARYRMLGNAVCVNVARWIGQRLTAFA